MKMNSISFNTLADQHFEWVERMGWHNKTVLESLALIGSEIGEAANECMSGTPSKEFGEELADILLRTMDLAKTEGVNLEEVVLQAQGLTWRRRGLTEDIAELTVEFAKWVNTARAQVLGPAFGQAMGRVVFRVMEMAASSDVNLQEEIEAKLALNETRGTRGRTR